MLNDPFEGKLPEIAAAVNDIEDEQYRSDVALGIALIGYLQGLTTTPPPEFEVPHEANLLLIANRLKEKVGEGPLTGIVMTFNALLKATSFISTRFNQPILCQFDNKRDPEVLLELILRRVAPDDYPAQDADQFTES